MYKQDLKELLDLFMPFYKEALLRERLSGDSDISNVVEISDDILEILLDRFSNLTAMETYID